VHDKFIPHKEILSGNGIDTTNALLDRYWFNLGRKIAPESNLFTDPNISSLSWSISPLFSLTKLTGISQCSRITLRAVRLYESFINNQLPSKSEFALHPYYPSSRKGFPSHFCDRLSRFVARSKLSTLVTAGLTRKASSVHAPNPTNLIIILLLPLLLLLLLLLRRRRRRRRLDILKHSRRL